MRRRSVLGLLAGAAAWPLAARAQQPGRVARIGFLGTAARDDQLRLRNFDTFRKELRTLGHVEGQSIFIEHRYAERDLDRLPGLASELVRLNVDVIVASPTPSAVAAKKATDAIPIVMINVGDPVGLGLVASLARPGGNVTGMSYSVGLENLGKGLELLKDTVPNLRIAAILANPSNPAQAIAIKTVEAAGRALGIRIVPHEARGPADFDGAFAAMTRDRAQAVVVMPDTITVYYAARLAELALKHRIPSVHGFREQVEAGGLISYGPDFVEPFRRAASYVDKILKGAKPADLPVEQPTKFDLVINLKTARALGLTIPPAILARADEVIE